MRGVPKDLVTRPVQDTDREGLCTLIEGCFADYEGVMFDADGIDADLKAWATYLAADGGTGWVILDPANGDELIACGGVTRVDETFFELKRLYLKADFRGTRIAVALLNAVETYALREGGEALLAWSDSRFTRAHSFYRREGFMQMPETRDLNDPSKTTEYKFIKGL